MFVFMISILMLHQVYSACQVVNIFTGNTAVQAGIVDQHNAFRRAVEPTAADMLMMSWSDEVAASAQAWVDKCVLAHGPSSTRMLGGYELGQNLFFARSLRSWEKVIKAWYSEVANYRYPNGSNGRAIGHYTQVVWNSSYKVGCGVALCPNSIYYYGCNYYRAGNYRGVAPYKAGTPCSSCPKACDNKLCTNPCPYINKYSNCAALKKQAGCGNVLVNAWCPAECKCTDTIIPIGKK
ncbi:cysteine-rich venom protein latisemin [Lampris incognitus]|uniref:cysteine-rich venom protein latisemin n=1 Tax=Lampris incognitus TaxID=2546036 RepID=UPI0024B59E61|nr:cysteine-rich venom protein latisemin [Lampris incognitus]